VASENLNRRGLVIGSARRGAGRGDQLGGGGGAQYLAVELPLRASDYRSDADQPRTEVDALGAVSQSTDYADSWLLGLRYLTEKEVTWIAEYYRNGSGYSAAQLEDFYRYADAALNAGGAAAAKVETLARSGYGRANPGRDYAYLRASIKDPFDVLYLTRRSPPSSSGR
jgi:hypothetical protein